MVYAFGACTLDTDRYELRRAGLLCPLEPQALDVLAYLLEHRDRVVTKHELLDQLWPDRVVGEGILAQRLMTIRKAIGDSGRSQHCIKTHHGRGYRFAAAVAVHANALSIAAHPATTDPPNQSFQGEEPLSSSSVHASQVLAFARGGGTEDAPRRLTPPLFSRPPHFVGRDAELAVLAQWWTNVQRGMRQVGFIVGEPGIGKTALVDTFVAQLAAAQDIPVGRGQCVDHYGMGEPYLPVLEALGRLCRDVDGDRFVSCLRRCAPSWFAHLSALLAPADGEALVRATHGVTPSRMLRELTDALEVLTATRPLVLVLEDLHWSDRATLAWLAYMARRRDPAQVLILSTYRPGEMVGHAHPLRPLLAELQPHPQCVELVLDTLSAPAVVAYVNQRCTAATPPASVPQFIHQRTGGLPLFLVAIVDELVREQLLESGEKERERQTDFEARGEVVPDNLRQYIEQHLERLPDEDQALLEAASVAGTTFAVAAVAAGVAQPAETLEARFTALARQGQFIRASGTQTWPDGTMTACYQFKHALYHEVVYARVPAGHSMHLHQRIGARKEAGYGTQARQIAAELAVHFARGHDVGRAVHYLHYAAENALRRSAYQEAITHLTQGLEMLTSLPDAAERVQHELEFLATLGLALVATKGQAHAEVGRTYAHARALCHRLGSPAQLFQVLQGLLSFHVVRAQLSAAWDVSQQLMALAERRPDTSLRMVAHNALGETLLFQGALVPARIHLEQGIALYDPREHHGLSARAGFPGDLGVFCRCFAAHTLWHLGYPDQALQRIDQALALARELAHPYSHALALAYAAMLYQFRREGHLVHETAQTAMTLCRDHGFAYYLAWGNILQGSELAASGQGTAGMVQMRSGLAAIRATGAELRQPYYLGLLAQACGQTGQAESGLTFVGEGLAGARRNGECWHEAELNRLRGELLLLASSQDPEATSLPQGRRIQMRDTEVEQCFHQALAIARRQQAKSLELRAADEPRAAVAGQGQPRCRPRVAGDLSTTGSPKASTPPTCRMRRSCSTS